MGVNRDIGVYNTFFLIRPASDVTSNSITVEIVAHFDGRPRTEHAIKYSGEKRLSMTQTRAACDEFGGTFVNPFVANPTGVYLVSMWRAPLGKGIASPGDFRLLTGSDAALVSDLSEQDRTNLMQILAAEYQGAELANIVSQLGLPSCGVDCGATGAICSTVDRPQAGGCICPAVSTWSMEGSTLSCDDSLAIDMIVPGARHAYRRQPRDTWQRGTRAPVSWTVTGPARPLQLHIVPVNTEDTVVGEPFVISLSAEQVAEGEMDVELPLEFAPGARHAHVAFASADAVAVGPASWGRYAAVGYSFVLAGAGCIVDDVHGECVTQGECGGAADPGRVDGGVGSCSSITTLGGSATCCLPRTTPISVPAGGLTSPMLLLPPAGLLMYVGQQMTLGFVVRASDSEWSVRRMADTESVDAEDTVEWVVAPPSISQSFTLLAHSSVPPTLVVEVESGGERWRVYETTFAVDSVFAANTFSLASETTTFQLLMGEQVVDQVDATVRFPPCASSTELDLFTGDAGFTSVNTVGQCTTEATCAMIDAAETREATIFHIDIETLCGASLGDDVVCCRSRERSSNPGFRADGEDTASPPLSTAAVVALVVGAICLLSLAALACLAVLLLARRRRQQATAEPSVSGRSTGGGAKGRRVSRRSSMAHV